MRLIGAAFFLSLTLLAACSSTWDAADTEVQIRACSSLAIPAEREACVQRANGTRDRDVRLSALTGASDFCARDMDRESCEVLVKGNDLALPPGTEIQPRK